MRPGDKFRKDGLAYLYFTNLRFPDAQMASEDVYDLHILMYFYETTIAQVMLVDCLNSVVCGHGSRSVRG